MFCKQCGSVLKEGAVFCSKCGAQQSVSMEEEKTIGFYDSIPNIEPKTQLQLSESHPTQANKKSVSFGEAIRLYFKNYANFDGRATKSEFWWGFLFSMLVMYIPLIGSLWVFVALIPNVSLAIRRLHDIGKPGKYYLLCLIPLVGSIILIIYYCKDSDGDNQWGPAPR